jgi:lipopolysaccharide/colanic/teichoic acid biosynthesis glycosyltransferase
VFQYGAIQADRDAYDPSGSAFAPKTAAQRSGRGAARAIEITRILDVILAAAALIFLAPLFVPIALLIKVQDGGPILFAHRRIGRGGQYFKCLKFRSMVLDAEQRLRDYLATNAGARQEWAADHKLRNDPRITPVGAFLRKSSLDELPQLLNVLRGEMSLVGPRPIVEAEVVRYGRSFGHYCSVRPGITGLWQVSGRNDVSYGRRVALDRAYVRAQGPGLYLGIILRTIPSVLLSSGSY